MRIAVLCIGNELLLDEGAGPACGRYLASRYALPACVDVLDRAVMGLAAISDLRSHDLALVLDAVDVPGATPGTLFSFEPDDAAESGQMASLHEMRFSDVLAAAQLTGIACEGHCLGVQAENISPSQFVQALTPRVAAAVPLLAAAAVRWLREKTGEEIEDRLAKGDPMRAGQDPREPELGVKARDFSGLPAAASHAGEAASDPSAPSDDPALNGVRFGPLGVQLPIVYGDPDATVMADYLEKGLRAVGALEVSSRRESDASCNVRVEFAMQAPDAETRAASDPSDAEARIDALIGRFGLRDAGARDGARRLCAIVSPEITDYDCDALIGSCADVLGWRR